MHSYQHCPQLTKDKNENCQKIRNFAKFFAIGCVLYRVGDWDDLEIDLHVSLHGGFEKRLADIVPVFL